MKKENVSLRLFDRFIRVVCALFAIAIPAFALTSCSGIDYISAEEKDGIVGYFRERLSQTSPIDGDTVYWTKNGSVYHLYADCRFLSESDNVRHGSVAQCGRSDVCSLCEKARLLLENETDETAMITSVIVESELEAEVGEVSSDTATETTAALTEASEPIAPVAVTPSEPISEAPETTAAEDSDSSQAPETGTVYWTPGGSVWHSDPNCGALKRSSEVLSGSVDDSGKSRGCKICSK